MPPSLSCRLPMVSRFDRQVKASPACEGVCPQVRFGKSSLSFVVSRLFLSLRRCKPLVNSFFLRVVKSASWQEARPRCFRCYRGDALLIQACGYPKERKYCFGLSRHDIGTGDGISSEEKVRN